MSPSPDNSRVPRGLIGAILIPLVFFLAFQVWTIIQPLPDPTLRFTGISVGECPALYEIDVPECGSPPPLHPATPESIRSHLDTYGRYLRCSPDAFASDEEWTVEVVARCESSAGQCAGEIIAFDTLRGEYGYGSLERKAPYPGFVAQPEDSSGSQRYTLTGFPWRTYSLVVSCETSGIGGFAQKPVLVNFYQETGLNIRRSAMVQSAVVFGAGALLVVFMFLFRPGGPRAPSWLSRTRWVSVAVVSAFGAIVTGLVFFGLPPDLGGWDRPDVGRVVWFPVWGLCGAVVGVAVDFLRLRYPQASIAERLGYLIILILLIGILFPALQGGASRGAAPGGFGPLKAKHQYYFYLGLAVMLPLVMVYPPKSRHVDQILSGSILVARSKAVYLLGFSALGGLLAGLVSILSGALLRTPTPDPYLYGYYKPAGAFGILLTALPVLAAFSLAVSVGVEHPVWVRKMQALLPKVRAAADPTRRADAAFEGLEELVRRYPFGDAPGSSVREVALLYGPFRGFAEQDNDRRLLAKRCGLTSGELERRIGEIDRVLFDPEICGGFERRVDAPFLLVENGETFRRGKIVIESGPDPSLRWKKRAYDVQRNEDKATDYESLRNDVIDLVEFVLDDVVGPDYWSDTQALDRHRIKVTFEYETEGRTDLEGRSYGLPTALLVCQLAEKRESAVSGWAATGAVSAVDGNITSVAGVRVKSKVFQDDDDIRVMICPFDCVDEVRQEGIEALAVEDLDRAKTLGQNLASSRTGTRFVIGVRTVQQARAVLFGV